MSGKAYLTKKKRDTTGLLQIPESCRLILPSLSTKADPKKKTEDKDYKQAFTYNPNPAAYLIPLKEKAADIIEYTKKRYSDSIKALQRDQIRTDEGYPDTMLLSALFSILQYNKSTQAEAVIDIRDLLVYIGGQRQDTAPSHYEALRKKIEPLLYIGGIIAGEVYPVLSEYHIDTENRLLTFKSPYCIALIDQITQDQTKAGYQIAYCQDIKASICTARNKGAAAAVCFAACLILQNGKAKDKEITVKEKRGKNKTITYKSVEPGGDPHIKASNLISTQAAILERYEDTESYSDKNKYLQRVFTACSEYFDKYTDLDGYTFKKLHITKKTIGTTIHFNESKQ